MTTTVGTENQTKDLVQNLLHLEHDAIAAYEGTIARLTDPRDKEQIDSFLGDHRRHVSELTSVAQRLGVAAPTSGDAKQLLTTGKIAVARLAGDSAVIKAMKTNEDDTVQAYEQAAANGNADEEMRRIFETALGDERRHREWMERRAAA